MNSKDIKAGFIVCGTVLATVGFVAIDAAYALVFFGCVLLLIGILGK